MAEIVPFNHGHTILELCNVLVQTRVNRKQVKRNLISSIANLVYELPRELLNDLRNKEILGGHM